MRRISLFFCCLIPVLLFTQCSPRFPKASEIQVSWELISNTYSDEAKAKARFVITNNSTFGLNEYNWALYYSQAPRRVLTSTGSQPAELEWINGDWFRILPREGFQLGNGQEFSLEYEVASFWIKESDAPMGLYLVILDKEGNEKEILVLENYQVKPFVREEQIHRHHGDAWPIPTPSWQYANNQKMSLVPEADMKRVIPTPVNVQSTGERVRFHWPMAVIYQEGLENEAKTLAGLLEKISGLATTPVPDSTESPGNGESPGGSEGQGSSERPNSIFLRTSAFSVNGTSAEAYRLSIKNNRSIVLEGSDNAGVFYAIQTLMALMPAHAFSGEAEAVELEVLTIEDAPRFPYRGMHIDVSRNFQQKETILKVLDLLAFYKVNTLHFHLTEDEGWRIEIRDLPELTEVGGQRGHTTQDATAVHPAYGSGPTPYADGTHGSGFYTHEEFVEILRYANERHIRVIPEINLPGHARAAIKAMEARYERLMDEGDEASANEFRLIDPEERSEYLSAQSFTDNVINVARESVYRFFETVVDGIISMYEEAGAPLEIFHTGGDEVPEGSWTRSPMIDELLETMPWVTDPKNLQSYFFERAIEILRDRGLKIAGWEEVAMLKNEQGVYVPNPAFAGGEVIPYMWNSLWGHQDLGYRLANLGYPVVLCHVTNFYFDLAYNKDPLEPGLYWGGFVDTRDAWYYAPYDMFITTGRTAMGHNVDVETEYAHMERIRPEARERVIGLQAQLWSETILGGDMLEYYLLPKLIGFSESAWAAERSFERIGNRVAREAEAQKKWNVFANTMARREFPRLARLYGGYNYRIPLPGAIIEDGMLKANVEYPGLVVRYTMDGQDPIATSPEYSGPVSVTGTVKLKAFDPAGRFSRTITLE